ncbi:MAG: hypothetical protein MRY63_06495 [Neomegalonema sp.]|nr:hypothetical protein [Neomegalonema sp.]
MPTRISRTIGPDGDYPTLAAAFADLPPDLVALDQIRTFLLTSAAPDPGGASLSSLGDATRYVEIIPAPGQDARDALDPAQPFLPQTGPHLLASTGPALTLAAGSRLILRNLGVFAQDGPAIAGSGSLIAERCLFEANTDLPALAAGAGSRLDTVLIRQWGQGGAASLGAGSEVQASSLLAESPGGAWSSALQGDELLVTDTAIAGFSQSLDAAPDALSARNADDARVNLLETDGTITGWSAVLTRQIGAALGPDGASSVDILTDDDAAAFGYAYERVTVAADTSRYVASVYFRLQPGATSAAVLRVIFGSVNASIAFNPLTGSVQALPSSTLALLDHGALSVGNDWYLIWLTVDNPLETSVRYFLYPAMTDAPDGTDLPVDAVGSIAVHAPRFERADTPPSRPYAIDPGPVPDPVASLSGPEALRRDAADLRAPLSSPLTGLAQSTAPDLWGNNRPAVASIGALEIAPAPDVAPNDLAQAASLEPSTLSLPIAPLFPQHLSHSAALEPALVQIAGQLTRRAPPHRTWCVPGTPR